MDAPIVAIERKVQVTPRGSNKKVLAFEELGNFLELDDTSRNQPKCNNSIYDYM